MGENNISISGLGGGIKNEEIIWVNYCLYMWLKYFWYFISSSSASEVPLITCFLLLP
jgi:hypothetical protein